MMEDTLTQGTVTVLVVEPHEICRRAVRTLASTSQDVRIVGEASNPDGLEGLPLEGKPDVVLMAFENGEAPEAIGKIRDRYPDARILVLAETEDGESSFKAVRSGAAGLVPKSADPDDIRGAITAVARGEQVFDPSVSAEALLWAARNDGMPTQTKSTPPLTPREKEILGHLSEGCSAAEIASRLTLSRRTVEAHLANAYRKLGVHGRIEALREYHKLTQVLDRP